jgi:DNA-binding protein H-NS
MNEDLQTQQEPDATQATGTHNLQALLARLDDAGTHFCGWPAVQDEQSCYAAGLLMQRASMAIWQLIEQLLHQDLTASAPKRAKKVKVPKLLKAKKERKPSSLAGVKLAVKYRSGDNAWSGRGKKPAWVNAVEASGESLDAYRVQPIATDADAPA